MKNVLLLFVFFVGILSYGQRSGDVVIYSNTGEKFYVILNGIRQNNTPETNVKIEGLTDSWYSCKVISSNNTFTLEKNIGVKSDTLVTYRIVEKKGNYKMRFYSETSMGTAPATPDQTVVIYSPVEITEEVSTNTGTTEVVETTTTTTTTTGTMGGNTTGNGETETITTSTTVNGGNEGTTESINIDINISENGMSTNMNVTGTGTGTGESETVNTTTTTTTGGNNGTTYYEESTTTTSTGNGNGSGTTTYYEETTTTTTTTTTSTGNLYEDNDMTVTLDNATDANCSMSDSDFQALKTSVEKESFADDKKRVANLAAKNKCMSVDQIREIATLFSFSDDQMSFVKAAYENCNNKGDYYQLMDVFTFSDDKEELEKFLNSK